MTVTPDPEAPPTETGECCLFRGAGADGAHFTGPVSYGAVAPAHGGVVDPSSVS